MKISKKHLIKFLTNANSEMTKSDIENILLQTEEFMISTLKKNDAFKFAGITIEKKRRLARVGVNPKTKEKISILAKNTIRFRASKELLKEIQD